MQNYFLTYNRYCWQKNGVLAEEVQAQTQAQAQVGKHKIEVLGSNMADNTIQGHVEPPGTKW